MTHTIRYHGRGEREVIGPQESIDSPFDAPQPLTRRMADMHRNQIIQAFER